MHRAKPLPDDLVDRYRSWTETTLAINAATYRKLADEGQHPKALLISCCDSRVNGLSIFGATHGDFFVHRNIANLVPPYHPASEQQATSAVIEYAVNVLEVPHIIVMGHSQCGGVAGCRDMCEGKAPALAAEESFVGRWVDTLREGHARVAHIEDIDERTRALEHEAVRVSITNLLTFPYVAARVDAGTLELHGLWTDIATGQLMAFDGTTKEFVPV
ncbi:MAG: carbonic anhydrase [Pseudomonadota bacterium]